MFAHEKPDVHQTALSFVAWSYRHARELGGTERHMRDQLLRASISVPLNIAEGNGKWSSAERGRFLQIASGSALECAAILDVMRACEVLDAALVAEGKGLLERIVAMLTKMIARFSNVLQEEPAAYGAGNADNDYDDEWECEKP